MGSDPFSGYAASVRLLAGFVMIALMIALASACRVPVDELDGAFYAWDHRRVHCAIDIDGESIPLEQIRLGMDRAAETGEALELLVHTPGVTVTYERLEAVLAAARDRGLPFLTMTDLLRGPAMAAVSLQYDDWHTQEWVESMPLLAQYGARVTMFVGRYPTMSDTAHAQLGELAAAGHDIEAHSVSHRRGATLVEQVGVRAYLDDEVLPSIDLLRGAGFEVLSYAYPFGVRTEEMDDAILGTGSVEVVRSLAKNGQWSANPCPN